MQRSARIGGVAAIAALVALAACSMKNGAQSPPDVDSATNSTASSAADQSAAGGAPPAADQGAVGAAPTEADQDAAGAAAPPADPMNGIPASGLAPGDKKPADESPTRN
jgi:hypothetical protein